MITVNIHEAKAHFSELIKKVEQGETVQICRRNEPVVTMTFTEKKPKKKRVLGQHAGLFKVPDSFFDPLPDDLLRLYNGEGD